MTSDKYFKVKLLAGLVVLMVLTRYSLFRPLGLPSATLAAFFIAGIYLRQWIFPALLIGAAGFTDYMSVQAGSSSWCITPAYGFLIPAYLALWFGGRRFESLETEGLKQVFSIAVVLGVTTTVAFIISNSSFYALSGKEGYDDVSLLEYMQIQFTRYPGYILKPFLYTGTLVAIFYKGLLPQYLKSKELSASIPK